MKYQVHKISRDRCKIVLVAETSEDKALLNIRDEADRVSKESRLEQHYQRAISIKFGYKAHFLTVTEAETADNITAMFAKEM